MAALLTPVVLVTHGYHPFADDGAIYTAGVEKLLNPKLFPGDSVFVLAPTRVSIFAHVLAAIVRWAHISLPALLLLCHLLSIYLFLIACYRVAGWGAALLGACLFTLPVAGTSLSLMDPYVTARSFSTPFTLFALGAVLEERWVEATMWLILTAFIHPLMAVFAISSLSALALAQRKMWRQLAALLTLVILACTVVFFVTRHEPNPGALSRSYFFLSSWQWFEYLGLVIPLALLGFSRRPLAIAAVVSGICALSVSICLVHRSGSLALARLQPLRAFHFVYLAGLLIAGSFLPRLPKRVLGAVAVMTLALMFTAQRSTYSSSRQVEWPWLAPQNEWNKAFLWIRENTPQTAIFALDNDYIESPGEDAEGFRAVAERSALPDYFKDGGIASNFPRAAALWSQGSQATARLNEATDEQRRARLVPLGATWIVLPVSSPTAFSCPYVNLRVRVCRLGPF